MERLIVVTALFSVCTCGVLLKQEGSFVGKALTPDQSAPPTPGKKHAIQNNRIRRETCEMSPTKLTADEQEISLAMHNYLRGALSPTGADEFSLEWDEMLAERAQAWADKCIFEHDFLVDCEGNNIGQNLYITYGDGQFPTLDVEQAIKQWYDERPFFDLPSASCQTGKVCGHYTQVVWADTRRVGCGVARCPTLMNPGYSNITSGVYLVCTYNPPGNYKGETPYLPGLPCSQCDVESGGVKCENNLCVPCLPELDETCKCPSSACENGGVFNEGTCQCACQEGYYGSACSLKCEDHSPYCAYWAGYCTNPSYKGFMETNCPKTCTFCPS